MVDGYFKCMVHHGSKFIRNNDHLEYKGSNSLWDCIEDKWSYFEILQMLKELNYPKGVVLWCHYGREDQNVCLKEFIDDQGALEMVNIVDKQRIFHLYVEYLVVEAEIIHCVPSYFRDDVQVEASGNHSFIVL